LLSKRIGEGGGQNYLRGYEHAVKVEDFNIYKKAVIVCSMVDETGTITKRFAGKR
jgi:hypothetical protein